MYEQPIKVFHLQKQQTKYVRYMKRIKISGKVPNARKSVLTNHGNTKIQMETQNKLWKLKELGKELS